VQWGRLAAAQRPTAPDAQGAGDPGTLLGVQTKIMMNDNQDSILSQIEFKDKDILEIGCGYGGFTIEHLLGAKSVFGLDTNSEAIESLKKEWEKYQEESPGTFQEGDIVSFPLQDKEFDIAIFSHSF
jgi:ubiquinone/menaquinone biosynthesis C-methylase UbiE